MSTYTPLAKLTFKTPCGQYFCRSQHSKPIVISEYHAWTRNQEQNAARQTSEARRRAAFRAQFFPEAGHSAQTAQGGSLPRSAVKSVGFGYGAEGGSTRLDAGATRGRSRAPSSPGSAPLPGVSGSAALSPGGPAHPLPPSATFHPSAAAKSSVERAHGDSRKSAAGATGGSPNLPGPDDALSPARRRLKTAERRHQEQQQDQEEEREVERLLFGGDAPAEQEQDQVRVQEDGRPGFMKKKDMVARMMVEKRKTVPVPRRVRASATRRPTGELQSILNLDMQDTVCSRSTEADGLVREDWRTAVGRVTVVLA